MNVLFTGKAEARGQVPAEGERGRWTQNEAFSKAEAAIFPGRGGHYETINRDCLCLRGT